MPAEADWYKNRGLTHLNRAALDDAEAEFEQVKELSKKIAADKSSEQTQWRTIALGNLGLVAESRGKLDTAEEYHQQSLEIFRGIGDRRGQAKSLNNLGAVARNRGELDTAQEYYERSLKIFREVGDRHGQTKRLGNLGLVAEQRGELDTAQDYFKKESKILLEIGAVLIRSPQLIVSSGFVRNRRRQKQQPNGVSEQ